MDFERYPCLSMAYEAGKKGNIYPTVLNASNDICVKLFLEDKITFLMIEEIVKEELERTKPVDKLTIEVILETEKEVKNRILDKYGRGVN